MKGIPIKTMLIIMVSVTLAIVFVVPLFSKLVSGKKTVATTS